MWCDAFIFVTLKETVQWLLLQIIFSNVSGIDDRNNFPNNYGHMKVQQTKSRAKTKRKVKLMLKTGRFFFTIILVFQNVDFGKKINFLPFLSLHSFPKDRYFSSPIATHSRYDFPLQCLNKGRYIESNIMARQIVLVGRPKGSQNIAKADNYH